MTTILVAAGAAVAACGSAPPPSTPAQPSGTTVATSTAPSATAGSSTAAASGEYRPGVTPADFPTPTTIDNPYFPLVPGTRTLFEGTSADGTEKIVKDVLRETRSVMGVTTVVVHDYVDVDGQRIEDTVDWFAQDKAGNVWYFGEATMSIDDATGKLTDIAGSWEAGVAGAQPGIVMKAHPTVGDRYRQEYSPGEAEDEAEVLATGETITTPAGTYSDALRLKDFSALEPAIVEEKLYARGIGFVFVEHVKGPAERIQLTAIEKF